jgi:hypothetical protein
MIQIGQNTQKMKKRKLPIFQLPLVVKSSAPGIMDDFHFVVAIIEFPQFVLLDHYFSVDYKSVKTIICTLQCLSQQMIC